MTTKEQINIILRSLEIAEKKVGRPIQLVAVSKYVGIDRIRPLVDSGITHLAENRIQDAIPKIEALNKDYSNLTWHLIGHLQANKVKKAVHYFDWIQSIDSIKLLYKINACATSMDKVIQGLIQINIGEESQKYGFSIEAMWENLDEFMCQTHVQIRGLMAILPQCNSEESRVYFEQMSSLYEQVSQNYEGVDTLSMGMSQDYELAIQKGATMVRVGSKFFVL